MFVDNPSDFLVSPSFLSVILRVRGYLFCVSSTSFLPRNLICDTLLPFRWRLCPKVVGLATRSCTPPSRELASLQFQRVTEI